MKQAKGRFPRPSPLHPVLAGCWTKGYDAIYTLQGELSPACARKIHARLSRKRLRVTVFVNGQSTDSQGLQSSPQQVAQWLSQRPYAGALRFLGVRGHRRFYSTAPLTPRRPLSVLLLSKSQKPLLRFQPLPTVGQRRPPTQLQQRSNRHAPSRRTTSLGGIYSTYRSDLHLARLNPAARSWRASSTESKQT